MCSVKNKDDVEDDEDYETLNVMMMTAKMIMRSTTMI